MLRISNLKVSDSGEIHMMTVKNDIGQTTYRVRIQDIKSMDLLTLLRVARLDVTLTYLVSRWWID